VSCPRDIRLIRKSLTRMVVSHLSDEHLLPVILGVRIDGLNELGYRTTHIAPAFSGGGLLNTLCVSYERIHGQGFVLRSSDHFPNISYFGNFI